MATASGAAYAARHPSFIERVTASIVKHAKVVLAEIAVAHHDQRIVLAQKAVAGDTSALQAACATIAALNPAAIDVDAADFGLTDLAIDNAVAADWNTMAGVDSGTTAP